LDALFLLSMRLSERFSFSQNRGQTLRIVHMQEYFHDELVSLHEERVTAPQAARIQEEEANGRQT
jgi:hypothetical protein